MKPFCSVYYPNLMCVANTWLSPDIHMLSGTKHQIMYYINTMVSKNIKVWETRQFKITSNPLKSRCSASVFPSFISTICAKCELRSRKCQFSWSYPEQSNVLLKDAKLKFFARLWAPHLCWETWKTTKFSCDRHINSDTT